MAGIISIDPATAAVTLLMAGGLIGLGYWQIRAIRQQIQRIDDSTRLSERANRADLIVRIDTIHQDIIDGRRDAWDILRKCKKKHPTDTAKCYQAMANFLGKLRESQKPEEMRRYFNLHKILDFGELVGFLVLERKLLTLDDVKGLWGTSLKSWAQWFGVHITNLQKEYPDAYTLFIKLSRKL